MISCNRKLMLNGGLLVASLYLAACQAGQANFSVAAEAGALAAPSSDIAARIRFHDRLWQTNEAGALASAFAAPSSDMAARIRFHDQLWQMIKRTCPDPQVSVSHGTLSIGDRVRFQDRVLSD